MVTPPTGLVFFAQAVNVAFLLVFVWVGVAVFAAILKKYRHTNAELLKTREADSPATNQ